MRSCAHMLPLRAAAHSARAGTSPQPPGPRRGGRNAGLHPKGVGIALRNASRRIARPLRGFAAAGGRARICDGLLRADALRSRRTAVSSVALGLVFGVSRCHVRVTAKFATCAWPRSSGEKIQYAAGRNPPNTAWRHNIPYTRYPQDPRRTSRETRTSSMPLGSGNEAPTTTTGGFHATGPHRSRYRRYRTVGGRILPN